MKPSQRKAIDNYRAKTHRVEIVLTEEEYQRYKTAGKPIATAIKEELNMKKYYVTGDYTLNAGFWSNSRDAKKHLQDNGGTFIDVYDIHGTHISGAKRDADGTVYSIQTEGTDDLTAEELTSALKIRR